MKLSFLLSVCFALAYNAQAVINAKNQWAVLVAGSKFYDNYRHQADVCHAYQLLLSRGFDPEHIITFSYDDVPTSIENVYRDELYNHPSLTTDVYKGCVIDYKQSEVTPANFLAVLSGKTISPGKKTLRSGPSDHVFINFVDHGGPGVLCFPDEDIDKSDFINTLLSMQKQNRFKRLLLFVEACYAGSMFHKSIPDQSRILAITAADPVESSWATYFCDHLDTFLGDLFSVKWMELADSSDMSKFGLLKEFETVKGLVNRSHVSMYGDLKSFHETTMADFIGPKDKMVPQTRLMDRTCKREPTPSPEVETVLLTKKYLKHITDNKETETNLDNLFDHLQIRQAGRKIASELSHRINGYLNISRSLLFEKSSDRIHGSCYSTAVKTFRKQCAKLRQVPEVTETMFVLLNACHYGMETTVLSKVVRQICQNHF